jgi:hypothetical protein
MGSKSLNYCWNYSSTQYDPFVLGQYRVRIEELRIVNEDSEKIVISRLARG